MYAGVVGQKVLWTHQAVVGAHGRGGHKESTGRLELFDFATLRVETMQDRADRIVVNALEPRSAVAEYAASDGRFTLHLGCQGVFGMRNMLKDILGVPPEKVLVTASSLPRPARNPSIPFSNSP